MSIVVKRARKYFLSKDGSPSAVLEEGVSNDALLRTIKIGKNIFKLSLPESAYDANVNYSTVPQPARNKSSLKQEQSTDILEVNKSTNNVQKLPKIVRITSDDETNDEGGKRRGGNIKVTNITTTVTDTEVNINETSLKRNASRNVLKTSTEETDKVNSNRKTGDQ